MNPIIKLKNVDITYNLGKKNEFKAVGGLNLEIFPGEFIAFFGPSGCGKSTIFYAILGVLMPSAGEILVHGENPYAFNAKEMVHFQTKIIGIIYQAFYLIPSLSVMDNVILPLMFQGIPHAKRKRRGQELLDRFGIGTKGENFPMLLSGGQSQRVSVARSMVNNPKIILADEPTGNLDSKSSTDVMNALSRINQADKKTIIMITHNASQLQYAHRVFYLKDGKLLRIVPNPDMKQIAKFDKQKILVTEIELLSKMFPYLPPDELKVKSIVNYLTQDLNFIQINNLEKAAVEMLNRKMSGDKFFDILRAPTRRGGVSLPDARAKQMTDTVLNILKHSESVSRYRRRLTTGMFYNREDKIIKELLEYMMNEANIDLKGEQKSNLKMAIRQRVAGIIRREEFERLLTIKIKEEGVNLNKKDRTRVIFYFEKLLTQGIDTKTKS